jgi:hypothetical protein
MRERSRAPCADPAPTAHGASAGDQLAVLVRRHAVRSQKMGWRERAIPAAAQLALQALFVAVD